MDFAFYATPDATTAFLDLGERWSIPSDEALVRVTRLGLDIVEALQVTSERALVRLMPWKGEILPHRSRFEHFDAAGERAGVPVLPDGAQKFALRLPPDLAQRLMKVARRENAWRAAGYDLARRPANVTIHGAMGWATYEGLILARHRLFPATKAHQRGAAPIGLSGAPQPGMNLPADRYARPEANTDG
jgi:hypothetical protein